MAKVWIAVALLMAGAGSVAAQQAQTGEGEQLFNLVCTMCHSVNPPAKAAPPMSHAAAYYVRKFADRTAAVGALVAFLKEPAAERSAMPAHAIERFGLMPPQSHLSDAQLQAVARYALTLADTTHVHRPGH
jgi:cytochrome c